MLDKNKDSELIVFYHFPDVTSDPSPSTPPTVAAVDPSVVVELTLMIPYNSNSLMLTLQQAKH